MITFSSLPTMSMRLPAGQTNASTLQLIVVIRDQLDCVWEVDLPSVVVRTDSAETDQLIQSLQKSSNTPSNSPLVQILSSGNQNAVGQVLSSLSQQFNDINTQALQSAADSESHKSPFNGSDVRSSSFPDGIPLSSVAVSALGSSPQPTVSDSDSYTTNDTSIYVGFKADECIRPCRLQPRAQQLCQCPRLPHDIHQHSGHHHSQQCQDASLVLVAANTIHESTHSICLGEFSAPHRCHFDVDS